MNDVTLYTVYLGVTIFASAFLIGFMIYEQFGGDVDSDVDVNTDSFDAAKAFSIKAIIGFMFGFGLGGLQSLNAGLSGSDTIIIASLVGFGFYIVMVSLIYIVQKLKTQEHVKLDDTIGQTGIVTISIKPNEVGKINVKVGETLREMKARTYEENTIILGKQVKVVGIESGVLVVETI